MVPAKELLTFEEIDDLAVMELPERELMQCSAVIGCISISNVLNNNTVTVNVPITVQHVCVSVLGSCAVV